MNQRIEKLTDDQEKLLVETYKQGLQIGRDCTPINIEKIAPIINEFYARIGKKPPLILRFSSPYMSMIAMSCLGMSLKNRDQLRGQLSDQLWNQLSGQLRDQLNGQLSDQLWNQLNGQLRDQLSDQLYGQLSDQLRGQLSDQLSDQLNLYYFAGQQWCSWEIFYDYCNKIGVIYTEDQRNLLDLWIKQSKELHWWWPMEGICIVSDRPEYIKTDEQGRLDCKDGPAIHYSDNWNIYAMNGVRIPEKYFLAETTYQEIEKEENAEIRRKLIERYGLQKFLEDSGAEKISEDEWGILYKKDVKDDEPIVMVSVLNSTPEESEYEGLEERIEKREFRKSELGTKGVYKRYMLRVPPVKQEYVSQWTGKKVINAVSTPLQALAWTAQLSPDEYKMIEAES